jgi:GTPase
VAWAVQTAGHATILRMFLDRVKIWVSAGAGGDGAATFRQEAHVPRGGPDGGDGGRGGSVHLRVDAGQTTLRDFRYKHHFRATAGGRGTRSRRHGAAGEDLFLDVPPGTAVYDDETGALVADLVRPGQTAIVGRGGRGGLGNTHFKTSTHQAPKHAQKGEPGEERWLRLELRLIADIGLVGLPNAGKSTLLAALTAATPKIADYPFTTLEPNLGVMDLGDEDERRPTIADVPGLIEGASSGAGLGHAFLRHVERTRILVHVVDGSSRDPEWDHGVIRDELEAHDPKLLDKPILVVFNKLDLPAAHEAWPAFRKARERVAQDVIAVSAMTGEGIPGLSERLAVLLPSADELGAPPEPAGVVVHRLEAMSDGFVIDREEGAFRLRGKRIERIAAQTNFEIEESAERFQRDLARLGIDAELRRAGIAPGDLVRIGASELEWEAQPWEDR